MQAGQYINIAKLKNDILSEVNIEVSGKKQIGISNKVLVIGQIDVDPYLFNVPAQLVKNGLLFDYVTLTSFAMHYKEFAKEYGTLIMGSYGTRISTLGNVTVNDAKNALEFWMANGNKLIYLNSSANLKLTKTEKNNTVSEVNIASLFGAVENYPVVVSPAVSHSQNSEFKKSSNYTSLDLLLAGTKPHGRYSLNASNLTHIIVGKDDANNDIPFVSMKVNQFIYVAYGGFINGQVDATGAYQYVDVGLLIKILWGNQNKAQLAFDLQDKKRIVATGVDCDVTTEPEAIETILKAWGDRPLELGLVVYKVTDELNDYYRSTGRDIVTHGYWHHMNNTEVSVTETYVIPSDNIVRLKKPYKVIMGSVSIDGTTLTSATGVLQESQYEFIRYGFVRFHPNRQGDTVSITYSRSDEPKEWIGSINALNDIGLLSKKAVYLTGGSYSVHPMTYAWAQINDVVICDMGDFSKRASLLLENNVVDKKLTPWYGTSFSHKTYGISFDAMFLMPSETEAKNLVFDTIDFSKERNQPFVWYTHDFFFSENHYVRIFGNPDGRFPSWWANYTLDEVRQKCEEMMRFWLEAIDESGEEMYWMVRSDYNKRFEDLIKGVNYSSQAIETGERLLIENSNKSIKGITFRKSMISQPTSVLCNAVEIPYAFNNGELIFSLDLAAGEYIEVFITLLSDV